MMMMAASVYLAVVQQLPQTEAQTNAQSKLDDICRHIDSGIIQNYTPEDSNLIFQLRGLANCDTDAQQKLNTLCLVLKLDLLPNMIQQGDAWAFISALACYQ